METMEANNKAAHAENETAIERLRTDMERTSNSNTTKLMIFTGVAVAAMGVLVSIVSLIINLVVK